LGVDMGGLDRKLVLGVGYSSARHRYDFANEFFSYPREKKAHVTIWARASGQSIERRES